MTNEHTRRSVLKTSTAVGSLAATGALAGCLGDDSGDGNSDGNEEMPVEYTGWLPAPALFDSRNYAVAVIDDQRVRASEDHFGNAYDPSVRVERFPLAQMGVDYAAVDARIGIKTVVPPSTRVVFGGFDRSDVVEALEGNGFQTDGEYSGYTLLTGEQAADISVRKANAAIAVRDERVVATRDSELEPAREQTETVIDTSEGEADRYVETSDEMSLLTDELGGGIVLYTRVREKSGQFWGRATPSRSIPGVTASGQTVEVDGETSETTFILVSKKGADINFDDVEEWTRQGPEFDAVSDLTVSLGGNDRTVTVTGQGPTANLIGTDPRRQVGSFPTASFSYEYDQTAGELTIQHHGGDTLDPGLITLEGSGLERRGQSWADLDPSVEQVTVGDEVTLAGVEQEFLLEVTWIAEDGSIAAVISAETGPERRAP